MLGISTSGFLFGLAMQLPLSVQGINTGLRGLQLTVWCGLGFQNCGLEGKCPSTLSPLYHTIMTNEKQNKQESSQNSEHSDQNHNSLI